MAKNRRTIKKYRDLFDFPGLLFKGVETVLYPNGQNEIWFKTADGLGFRVKVSNGPHGLALEASRFIGGPDLTFTTETGVKDAGEMNICQYRQTNESQDFKKWYMDRYRVTPERVR